MRLALLRKKSVLAAFLAAAAFICYLLGNSHPVRIFDNKWRDMLFAMRGPVAADDRIVVCTLDENSFEVLEQELPFSPETYIRFFRNLKRLGVRVVGLDFILYEFYKSDPDTNDVMLRNAFADLGGVVFASKIENYFSKQKLGTTEISTISSKYKTSNRYFSNTGRTGLINSTIDFDGVKRSSSLFVRQNGVNYETFIYRLYEAYLETAGAAERASLPGTAEILAKRRDFIVNYAGGPRHFVEVPFYAIAELPESSIEKLRRKYEGKIFLVGPTYYESHDFFDVPFSNSQYVKGFKRMPGVETVASSLHTILGGRFIDAVPRASYDLVFAAFAALSVATFTILSGFLATTLLAAIYSFGAFALSYSSFIDRSAFLDITSIVMTIGVTYVAANVIRKTIFESEKAFMRTTLNRYISSKVVEKILRDGERVDLDGELAEVAVMFADVRGFTSISEKLSARSTVKLLNNFFKTMVDIVFKNEGTLDKFIGDCLMVVFGAPQAVKLPVSSAVRCAIEMQKAIMRYDREKDPDEYGLKFDFGVGIGISFGKCVVGNIGSAVRMEYTAIGDIVNTASRIQPFAGPGEITLTAAARDALAVEDPEYLAGLGDSISQFEEVRLKGKENAVLLYKIRVEE